MLPSSIVDVAHFQVMECLRIQLEDQKLFRRKVARMGTF